MMLHIARTGLLLTGLLTIAGGTQAQTIGKINQDSTNKAAISNTGVIAGAGTIGTGASASISATGSVASLSSSTIGVHTSLPNFTIGNVRQTSTNGSNSASAPITNSGTIDMTGAGLVNGNVRGNGASVSVGASGAVATISTQRINSGGNATKTGTITQKASNTNSAISNTGSIAVGNITGNGASVGISATGAITSIAVSTINAPVGHVQLGNITQTSTNKGAGSTVSNSGSIALAGLTGRGASASISATGAAAVVSFSNIAKSR